MDNGWVKIFRKLDEWGWYKDSKTLHLFIHLLLHANHKSKTWQGITVERGQFVTGLLSLKTATGISIQTIRTGLARLEATGEITQKSTNKFTIITLCNYSEYQGYTEDSQQTTNKQLTNNQQTTNNKQECKKEKNIIIETKTLALTAEKKDASSSFDTFWQAYPKKKSKGAALKAWHSIKADGALLSKMFQTLSGLKNTVDWKKENGRYIPYPASWLNAQGWEDELPPDPNICYVCKRHMDTPGIGILSTVPEGLICRPCKKLKETPNV